MLLPGASLGDGVLGEFMHGGNLLAATLGAVRRLAKRSGAWPDASWKGWWGDNPPYQVPVFVLTQHARAPIPMQGGTTFHFVTGGIHEALERAREAAGQQDVRIGGGESTVRQYLQAGLVDEIHLAVSPTLLGSGEALLAGLDLKQLGFRCTQHAGTEHALHAVFTAG